MHPYRTPAKSLERKRPLEHPESDLTLAVVLGSIWILSLARVVLGLLRHETFGAEASIALVLVLLLPAAVKSSIF